MLAPFLPEEPDRLRTLESLSLLDTVPEPVFDCATRLASQLLKVPVSLFSLIDAERQWFKSRVGLEVRETPREQAFCAHAIAQPEPLVVPDALLDPRFRDNPLVTGAPHIRFYAGVPIRAANGHAIGTLCVIDSVPRTVSAQDIASLQDLAELVAREVRYREALLQAGERIQEADGALLANGERYRSIFELADVGIALVAPGGAWISANNALCATVGYTQEELRERTYREMTYPEDLEGDLLEVNKMYTGEIDHYQAQKRYVKKDGSLTWVDLNVSKKAGRDGKIEYFIAVVKDINAQKNAERDLAQLHAELEARVDARTRDLELANGMLRKAIERQTYAEHELRRREAELSSVLENANDAYISLDESGTVTAWNRQAEVTFGWSVQEALGQPLDVLIIPDHMVSMHRKGMARYLATGKGNVLNERLELPAMRKDGSTLTVEIRIRALDINGRVLFSAFLHDISDRKELEARREYESRHDSLTGLLNRRALNEAVPVAQARASRQNSPLGVLFIDLDGFKAVNDTHGHEAGDEVLRVVAARLHAGVRKTDSVFRLAGDEFTILLESLNTPPRDAHLVARKLIAALSEPIELAGTRVGVGASIGLAIHYPGAPTSPAELLKEADRWMYEAKRSGRGKVCPPPP